MTGAQQTATFNLLLLFLIIFLHKATSTTYYVIPDDDYSSHHYDSGANSFSLQHYLNNTSKYFVSHNQFHFIQGQYHISNDLIFKDINNFFIGIVQCVIICTSPASIVVVNVSNVTLQNIKLINCMKHQDDYFNVTYLISQYMYRSMHDRRSRSIPSFSKVTNYHTSVFLYNSSSVTVAT